MPSADRSARGVHPILRISLLSCRVGSVGYAWSIGLVVWGCSQPAADRTAPATAPAATAGPTAESRRVSGKAPIVDGQPSIVLLVPAAEPKSQSEAGVGVMDQAVLTFLPSLLFVRTGQATEFRNSDDVLHNVNVKDEDTKAQAFNVAIPTGEHYRYTFAKDGFYGVRCDIHPSMWALIVATSSPYAAQTDGAGAFSFDKVEAGAYTVRVYAGSQKLEQTIDVTAGSAEVNFAPN